MCRSKFNDTAKAVSKMVLTKHIVKNELCALVVELVDTRDLKSLGVRAVPVQVRPGAPSYSL